MSEKNKKVLSFEPEKIPEGTCIIKESLIDKDLRYSICKEQGKIKIFPIITMNEEED